MLEALAPEIGRVEWHRWVAFRDANGKGFAEPEAFIVYPKRVILFEVKLTGGMLAKFQMEQLYKPLLEAIHQRPVHCLQVCKWPTADAPGPRFDSVLEFIRSGATYGDFHWLGDT